MAITERYVRQDADGTGDGTTDANSGANGSFTWSQMVTDFNLRSGGYRYNVKYSASSYSIGELYLSGDGTVVTGMCIRGYNSAIGDLDNSSRSSTGALVTTNFPTLAYSGAGGALNATGAQYLLFKNFIVTGSLSTGVVRMGLNSIAHNVKATNAGTGSALQSGDDGVKFISCDGDTSGGASLGGFNGGANCVFIDCRTITTVGAGIICGTSSFITNCIFGKDITGESILYSGVAAGRMPVIVNCTSYSAGYFFRNSSHALVSQAVIINCHVTDTTYLAENLYAGTGHLALFMYRNRTRDLSSGVSTGYSDWATLATLGAITTAGSAAADYTDSANNDLSLISTAPGRGVGIWGNDIGAITKQAAGGVSIVNSRRNTLIGR